MRTREEGSNMAVASTETRPADVGLKREMGLIGATWASETSIIGSGWLFGSLFAAQAAGTAALLGWIIGGISFGFFSWVQAITVAPIECYAVFTYLSYYWHGAYTPAGTISAAGLWATVGLMAIFTAVNFFSMRIFNRVNAGITWWKVAVPVFTIIVLLFQFHPSNFTAGGAGFAPGGIRGLTAALPLAGIIFAYSGFEQCDQLAGEIKNPGRNLPRAIILSVLIGTAIYVLLQVAFIGAMPSAFLGHHGGLTGLVCPDTGTCNTTIAGINAGPFAALAVLVGFGWLGHILRVDAFVSPSGTGLIYTTGTSRISYGLARNRYAPQIFARVDARGVPWVGLIFAFLFGLVFLLPFPSWRDLVGVIVGASVLMYAGAPLSVGAFRSQVPDANRPYRMPWASFLAPASFVVADLLIYWSGWKVVWKLGIVLIIGYVLIGISMAFDKQRPPLDWKNAIWLPVWLAGLAIVTWQGQYGPGNTGNIPFWWDMLIVAVFSIVIFYWAMATKLPREEMLNLVGRQSSENPEDNLPPAPRH